MIDEKYIELMHKELDGVISAGERKLLMGYLLEHADAKIFYQELKETVVLLDKVPQADVPEKMRERIMNSINKEKYARDPYRGNVPEMIQNWFSSPRPKMAFTFALGVLFGIIVIVLWPLNIRVDNSSLYGTMGLEKQMYNPVVESVSVHTNGIKGSIKVVQTKDLIRIETDLRGEEQYDLFVEYDNEHLLFENFRLRTPGEHGLNTQIGKLEIINIDDLDCVLTFQRTITIESLLKITIAGPDTNIFTHKMIIAD